jgi:ribonuclease P protein subunit RPR2
VKRNKAKEKREALAHITDLFREAEDQDAVLATKMVKQARRIAMKYRVSIPKSYSKKFCRHCYIYFIPGKNMRVRTTEGKLTTYCMDCKKYSRIPFVKEQKARRIGSERLS